MQCGAKRFVVRFYDGEIERTEKVTARTPALARKVIRANCGEHITIHTVKSEQNK